MKIFYFNIIMNKIFFSLVIFVILSLVVKQTEGFLSYRKNCKKNDIKKNHPKIMKKENLLCHI